MNRKRTLCLLPVILLALVVTACAQSTPAAPSASQAPSQSQSPSSASAPAGEPLLIGEIFSGSGINSTFGQGQKSTLMAIEEINAAGGVLGRPLQLVSRDDKSSPEEATKLMRELASNKDIVVIVGNTGPSTFALNTFSQELKMPYFANGGYPAALTEKLGHRYFFRMVPSDRVIGYAMAEMLAKEPVTRFCTIGNDFSYGRSITATVMGRLKQLNPAVQVIPGCEFWVPLGHLDFTPQITAIMGQKPDAVMFGGVIAVSSDAFVKQAKAFGLFNNTLGVHPTLGMPVNMWGLQKGDLPEGILTGSDFPYPPIASVQPFFEAFQKRWNEMPYEVAAHAYTTMHLIAKAIEKAGKVDREALVDALPGMSMKHPVMGEITIRELDNQSTVGWWFGRLYWNEQYKKAGLRDLKYVEGASYLPSADELRQMRS